uniref:MADF domain-containing protein n=1 Tax=Glossina brevipalpis TaxID=37001 RepID=A0A1A9WE63_9MUSC
MSTNVNGAECSLNNDLENDIKLCRIFKFYPCLYDRQSKLYANKKTCEAAWQRISRRCSDTLSSTVTSPIKAVNTTAGTAQSKNLNLTNGKPTVRTTHVGTMLPPKLNKTFTISPYGGIGAAAQRRAIIGRQQPQIVRRYSICNSAAVNTSNLINNNSATVALNAKASQVKPAVTIRRFATGNSTAINKATNADGNVRTASPSNDTLITKINPNSLTPNKNVKSTLLLQALKDDSETITGSSDPLQIKTIIKTEQRWQDIYRSFAGNQLSPNETNYESHYLYDYLEFLVPHIPIPFEDNCGEQTKNVDNKLAKADSEGITASKDEVVADVTTDSDTTSADETNNPLKAKVDEANTLVVDSTSGSSLAKCQSKVETFIIKPTEDDCNNLEDSSTLNDAQAKCENIAMKSEEQMPTSTEEENHRYHFRRACKRSLNEEMVKELRVEDKKSRRSVERGKNVNVTLEEEVNKQKPITMYPAKKLEVKVAKINLNNKKPSPNNKSAQRKHSDTESYLKVSSSRDQGKDSDQPRELSDASSQTDARPTQFDDGFLCTLHTQMNLMNARQKLNFKSKVYRSLMEAFDDGTNFPNLNEIIELPPAGAPRFHTTSPGELRLMRELVALVQAAKETPEIINANEVVNHVTTPTKGKNMTDTTTQTPSFVVASNASTAPTQSFKDTEVLGVPRHIIRKVVKVSGSSGGTLLTQDGEKKRIYRIYPKTGLNSNNYQQGASTSNTGTLYLGASRGQSTTDTARGLITTTVSSTVTSPIKAVNTTAGTAQSKNLNLTNGKPTVRTTHVGTMLPPKLNKTFTISPYGGIGAAAQRRAIIGRQQPQIVRRYSICNSAAVNTSNLINNNSATVALNAKASQVKPAVTIRRFATGNSTAINKATNADGNVRTASPSNDTLITKINPNSLTPNKNVKSTLLLQALKDDSETITGSSDPLQIKTIIKTEVID